jgi:type IV pilus assembly protein PilY1
VIHSRPLPVDYGGGTGVVIYYGAGDGVYRAVQGSTGQELWSFVAPEHYSTLQRLMDNSPLVLTPNPTPPGQTAISGTTGRDFFFDGSTGVYQNADSSKVWIYPAMRRGGRMLYAFDVTTPGTPRQKWRVGCPDQSDDTGCTTGMTGIGQTWSTPQVAKVNGYSASGTNKPVIIVGGGYDTCEDSDSATPSCSSPKGAAVYILDADTGSLLKTFTTTAAAAAEPNGPAVGRSVVADVTMVDTNGDGVVDYAYAADTGGSLYRIDFPSAATSASDWKMSRVAYTNITPSYTGATSNSYRKFLFAPGVLPYKGDVFVAIVSGDREHPLALSYPYTTPVLNRAYLYLDDPTRTTATDLDGSKMANETANPQCDVNDVLPGSTYYGWYLDLKAACSNVAAGCGEQGVTSALIFGGMVTWSTNRPTGAAETCSTSLGEARGYFANLLNGSGAIGVTGTCGGTASSVFPGGGLPPSAVAATVNVDGKEETILIGAPCKDGTSCAPIQAQQLNPPITSKRYRTYWKLNTDNK